MQYAFAILSAFSFLLVACGGSDTTSTADQIAGGAVPGPQSGTFNGGLAGRLVTTTNGSKPTEFILATGKRRELPAFNTRNYFIERGEGDPQERGTPFVAQDIGAVRYVATAFDCFNDIEGACVSIMDEAYQPTKILPLRNTLVTAAARVSRSGRYMLISQFDPFNDFARVLMYDIASEAFKYEHKIDLDILTRSVARHFSGPVIHWGADDRAIFTTSADERPTIYITEPGSMVVDRQITLPSVYRGQIETMDMHPDGNQLLLEYDPRGGNSDLLASMVIVLDLTTLDIRFPLLDKEDADRQPLGDEFLSVFSEPRWSPDGRHILIQVAITGAIDPILAPLGVRPRRDMLVVPAESNRLIIDQYAETYPDPVVHLAFEGEDGLFRYYWPTSGFWNWVR